MSSPQFPAVPGEPDPRESARRRFTRRTAMYAVGGTAAIAVALGGGAVALASGPGPSQTPSQTGSSSQSAPAPTPGKNAPKPSPHLDGTVVSSDGSTVVITDMEGFQRTIHVTSSTKYTNGLSASSIKTGTKIHAEGSVDSDRTSLDATTVGTMPTPPAGGPGKGGPAAPGGPGKGGPGGAGSGKPSGAPSGKPSGAPTGKPSAPSGSGSSSGSSSAQPTPTTTGS